MMSKSDKPLESKKFISHMQSSVIWSLLIAGGLWRLEHLIAVGAGSVILSMVTTLLMTMVIVKGFEEALYIGSVAALESYVKMAEVALGKKTPPAPPPPPVSDDPERDYTDTKT